MRVVNEIRESEVDLRVAEVVVVAHFPNVFVFKLNGDVRRGADSDQLAPGLGDGVEYCQPAPDDSCDVRFIHEGHAIHMQTPPASWAPRAKVRWPSVEGRSSFR